MLTLDEINHKLVASVKKDLSVMISGLVPVCLVLDSTYGQSGAVSMLLSIIMNVMSSKPTLLHVKYIVKEIVEVIANDIELELSSVRLEELLSEVVKLTGLKTDSMLVNLANNDDTTEKVDDDDEKLLHYYRLMYRQLGEKGGSLRMFSYTLHKWILQILMTIIRETRQPAHVSGDSGSLLENLNPLLLGSDEKMEEDNALMEDEKEQNYEEEEMVVQEQNERQDGDDPEPAVRQIGVGRGNWNIRVPLSDEHKQMVREIFMSDIEHFTRGANTIRRRADFLLKTLQLDDEYKIAMSAELRRLVVEQARKDRAKTRRSARSQPRPNYHVL